jgi:nucleoside-diphosphate-sugar epimerase
MATRTSARSSTSTHAAPDQLTVAVTGASGTIGPALLARLGASASIERVLVLGRHSTPEMVRDPKVEFRTVDVRDRGAVKDAVADVDVVAHMAFSLYGILQNEQELFATNVIGTANVAQVANEIGARRFVYTSSAAIYGGQPDVSQPLREDAEVRASARLFYSRHKAQAELIVREELAGSTTEAFIFRPCAIVGPHAAGSPLRRVPPAVVAGGRRLSALVVRAGLRPLLPAPPVPLQFVHEDDVAQALELAIVGRGEPGVYNLAGEGAVDGPDVLRGLGLRPLPLPRPLVSGYLQLIGSAPPLLPVVGWSELVKEPLLIDPSKARERLGWQPRFTSEQALAATRDSLGW